MESVINNLKFVFWLTDFLFVYIIYYILICNWFRIFYTFDSTQYIHGKTCSYWVFDLGINNLKYSPKIENMIPEVQTVLQPPARNSSILASIFKNSLWLWKLQGTFLNDRNSVGFQRTQVSSSLVHVGLLRAVYIKRTPFNLLDWV